mmetsp:Transcript_27899/g.55916  ORF Transcript_27899/g.55916 Transcript_27899/m.55916 type:complete len:109 (+) Transcript_27899:220-546(+)
MMICLRLRSLSTKTYIDLIDTPQNIHHTSAHHHHPLLNNTKNNLTRSSFQIRGGAKWSMDSFDGANVEMLDCHKGSQWRVLRRRILRDCMMTFMCPREGTIRWYLSSY